MKWCLNYDRAVGRHIQRKLDRQSDKSVQGPDNVSGKQFKYMIVDSGIIVVTLLFINVTLAYFKSHNRHIYQCYEQTEEKVILSMCERNVII